jgi:hypothetical protein
LFAENPWDTILPEKSEDKTFLIFGENVNVRKEANVKSEVVAKLQPGEKVKVIKKTNVLLTQGGMKEYWYQIQAGEKKGYVWGSLLADSYSEIGGSILLIRNPGARTKKLEFKVSKDGKILSSLIINPGPVANENWSFKAYRGASFSPNPGSLIGFHYLVYSEIEYAQSEEIILRIDEKGKISEFFNWSPGGCDPPSCMESWLLFPGETLASDPAIARKEYKSQPNSLIEITRSYDVDDASINEYSVSTKIWNGKSLLDKK